MKLENTAFDQVTKKQSINNNIYNNNKIIIAMPGFIALKLCPNLTIVPMNMKKYKEASNFTRYTFLTL